MPDIWGLAAIAAKFLLYLGVLTSTGTVFAAVIFQVVNIKAFTMVFAVVGMIGAVASFGLGGAALTGDASGMMDLEMLGLLWDTPVGTALSYRLVGLALLIAGLLFGRPGIWMSSLGGVLALWSFVAVGHVPNRDILWLNALLFVHLGGIALWIGILAPLKGLAKERAILEAAELGDRFGRLAAVFVPLLILAGIVMSYVLVGSISALIGTGYGQALIAKVIVVSFLMGLGALNKLRIVPQLMVGEANAALHLSRSISFEWMAVVLILFVTAILTSVLNLPS
ncbi:copper resistance D family protein [Roseovarius sp. EL26]|uniref:copper resistance D family protein n=1 Tax=Roseovarius sp. EL26 TaxID=2126672 RepID=UPI000EA193EC|nr:CopD family protein [Roseovarius sp. EL26]